MTPGWSHEVDLLVVGSGAGAVAMPVGAAVGHHLFDAP
jgi:hypothetical protein